MERTCPDAGRDHGPAEVGGPCPVAGGAGNFDEYREQDAEPEVIGRSGSRCARAGLRPGGSAFLTGDRPGARERDGDNLTRCRARRADPSRDRRRWGCRARSAGTRRRRARRRRVLSDALIGSCPDSSWPVRASPKSSWRLAIRGEPDGVIALLGRSGVRWDRRLWVGLGRSMGDPASREFGVTYGGRVARCGTAGAGASAG